MESLQPTRIITEAALGGGESGALDKLAETYAAFGMRTPIMRAIGTGGAVYALIHFTKPRMWYHENGVKRPWSVLSDRADAVLLSPEIVAALVGIVAAGF